jgi:hypothetical protein
MTTNKKIKRPGSGRTLGSVSFVTIPLKDLCAKIADPNTNIKVSRLQLEAMGFIVKPTDPKAVTLTENPAKQVTNKVTDFDEPVSQPINADKSNF